MKYRYIQDPGHGWLEVPVSELQRIGVQPSHYSYVNPRDGRAYLEEDCDMPKFIASKKFLSEPVEVIEVHQNKTFIRDLPSFQLKVAGFQPRAARAIRAPLRGAIRHRERRLSP